MSFDWPRFAAKAFAVVTMGVGVGFISGAIAFVGIGPQGVLFGSPFRHVADLIGWGSGSLTASLITSAMLFLGRPKHVEKPSPPSTRGLD